MKKFLSLMLAVLLALGLWSAALAEPAVEAADAVEAEEAADAVEEAEEAVEEAVEAASDDDSDDSTDFIAFDPTFANIFDQSSSDWYSSAETRALLTLCLGYDLTQAVPGFDTSLIDKSYVGKNPYSLTVCIPDRSGKYYVVLYAPLLKTANYMGTDLSSDFIELFLDSTCDSGYKKNDLETLLSVANALVDYLGS